MKTNARSAALIAMALSAVPALILYILALIGCVSSSPGLSNIYLVRITSNATGPIHVHAGYFGICVGHTDDFQCHPTASRSLDEILSAFSNRTTFSNSTRAPDNDNENGRSNTTSHANEPVISLISAARVLQSKIFTSLLAAAAFLFFLALVCTGVVATRRLSGNRLCRTAAMGLAWLSTTFTLMAALSVNQVASAVSYAAGLNGEGVVIGSGGVIHGLQWTTVVLTGMFAVGVGMYLGAGERVEVLEVEKDRQADHDVVFRGA